MVSKNELKVIKSLKVKKYRAREKRFIVEGSKNVLELLKSDFKVELVLSSLVFLAENREALRQTRTEVVTEKVLQDTSALTSNTTCLAVVELEDQSIDEIDPDRQTFVLDNIGDPGNLGTIIRTLDWFGFDQLVCSSSSADLYNPKTISSTMGSFTRVKTCYHDLVDFFSTTKLPTYGAVMNGTNLYKSSIERPSVIVMGSESHGISREILDKLDHSITIPRYGEAESLNVGIATGLIAGYLRSS